MVTGTHLQPADPLREDSSGWLEINLEKSFVITASSWVESYGGMESDNSPNSFEGFDGMPADTETGAAIDDAISPNASPSSARWQTWSSCWDQVAYGVLILSIVLPIRDKTFPLIHLETQPKFWVQKDFLTLNKVVRYDVSLALGNW